MTDAEKMIWVIAYSTEWIRAYNEFKANPEKTINIKEVVQLARAAVVYARQGDLEIKEEFGLHSEEYEMYREVIHGEHSKS